MDSEQQSPEYESFEPETALAQEEGYDTLLVYLPGFEKEQLKLQLTTTRKLFISGERLREANKWSRLRKEFPTSTNCDTNRITAQYKNGMLYIRQPKLIDTPEKLDEKKPASQGDQNSQQSTDEPRPQKRDDDQEGRSQEAASKSDRDNQTEGKSGEATDGKRASEGNSEGKKTSEDDLVGSTGAMGKTVSEVTSEGKKNREDDLVGGMASTGKSKSVSEGTSEGTKIGEDDLVRGRPAATGKQARMEFNLVLVILMALVLGIYVRNWIHSGKKE